MSRTGNTPIEIPDGIDVTLNESNIIVKNKTGEKQFKFSNNLVVSIENKKILIKPKDLNKKTKMIWGTTRSLLNSAVLGVSVGFERILELSGVGFRATLKGEMLSLQLGFSHDVNYKIPQGIKLTVEKQTVIKVSGIDKQLVGKVISEIKSLKPVEPYKGKGIKEKGQYVLRKEGKKK